MLHPTLHTWLRVYRVYRVYRATRFDCFAIYTAGARCPGSLEPYSTWSGTAHLDPLFDTTANGSTTLGTVDVCTGSMPHLLFPAYC